MKTMLPTISRTKKKKALIDMECYRSRIWTGIAKEMQPVTIPQITRLLLLQLQFWPTEGTPSNISVIKVLSTHTHTDMESYAPIVWDIKEPHIETGMRV